jgi:hypothetical protein
MKGHTLENGIEFFDFQSIGRIFFVFGGNVTRSSWLPRFFVLCTFQNYLNSISFLGHVDTYKMPWALASLITALIPFLLMVFNTEALIFRVIHLSSSGI